MSNLPIPDTIAAAHSEALQAQIAAEIAAHGPIPFARYMQQVLYAPGLGYYSAGAQKFGVAGDFVTAPEISPLFSQCVARQCQQVLQTVTDGAILELGAGSGAMAVVILQELARCQQLPRYYYILEVSADLRERQHQLLRTQAPELLARVRWLDCLPQHFNGVIVANEVLDAMPVHKFVYQSAGIQEYFVDFENNAFKWVVAAPSTPALTQYIKNLDVDFPEHYVSEVNLLLEPWLASLAQTLTTGLILLLDYGFPRREYYHPQRNTGTLMCHYRHHAHTDPFLYPGLQDVTAHVDFTAVATAAVQHDLTVAGYTHQAGFLLGCGIDSLLPSIEDVAAHYNAVQQVKRLTLPSEMGELVKALALTKNYTERLIGFTTMSQLERL